MPLQFFPHWFSLLLYLTTILIHTASTLLVFYYFFDFLSLKQRSIAGLFLYINEKIEPREYAFTVDADGIRHDFAAEDLQIPSVHFVAELDSFLSSGLARYATSVQSRAAVP